MKIAQIFTGALMLTASLMPAFASSTDKASPLDQHVAWLEKHLKEADAEAELKQAAPGSCDLVFTSRHLNSESAIYYVEKFSLTDIERIDPGSAANSTVFLYTKDGRGLIHSQQFRKLPEGEVEKRTALYADFVIFKFGDEKIRDTAVGKLKSAMQACKS